ncbi:hypothetical protein C7S13_8487 [Burkholderia cepacia]|nr:hypothetical protein [Burkholderia cepacia]
MPDRRAAWIARGTLAHARFPDSVDLTPRAIPVRRPCDPG